MTTHTGFTHNLLHGISAWSDWIVITAVVWSVISEQAQNAASSLLKGFSLFTLASETLRGAGIALAVVFAAILLNRLLARLGLETAVRCGAWAAADFGSMVGAIGAEVTKSYSWGLAIGTIVGILCFAAGYALTKYCARQVSRDLEQ